VLKKRINHNTIARIIDDNWTYVQNNCNTHQIRTLDAIRRCRTASLGGHLYQCSTCKLQHIRYNSCRNRHCPQCQNTQKERWILEQQKRLVGPHFYHIVFTIPDGLHGLFMGYPRAMYSLLMQTGWSVINDFGWTQKYLGAQIGATIVLHTWGANLSYHPHIHCIVTAGGVDYKGQWRQAKGNGKYLFPVNNLSTVFRKRMLIGINKFLQVNGMKMDKIFKDQVIKKDWVVYCKPPFGGKQGVVKYIARYTHKTAITNHRIKTYENNRVVFTYKDYKHGNRTKTTELKATEFVRRLSMHILPKRFRRIRHFGIVSGNWKDAFEQPSQLNQQKISWEELWKQKGLQIDKCPCCKNGKLIYLAEVRPVRGPPNFNKKRKHEKQH
jgi:hypothetical protein